MNINPINALQKAMLLVGVAFAACQSGPNQSASKSTAVGALASLEQVPGLGMSSLTAVATLEDNVFVATDHGVFVAQGEELALEPVGIASLGERDVIALTSFQGALFAVTFEQESGSVWRSTDAGAHWQSQLADVPFTSPRTSTWPNAQFASNAERLVVTLDGALYEWDKTASEWISIPTLIDNPHDSETLQTARFDRIAFEGDRLFVNADPYSVSLAGVLYSDAHDASWTRVSTLGVWGYYAFAFDSGRAVTSNSTELFVRDGTEWPVTFQVTSGLEPFVATDLFARDGVILAAGSLTLRRSTDGAQWTDVELAPSTSDEAFAATASRVFWIGDVLRSSTDLGASWSEHVSEIASPTEIFAHGDTVYASAAGALYVSSSSRPFTEGWGSAYVDLAVDGLNVWACSSAECRRLTLEDRQGVVVALPESVRSVPQIWMTSAGLFLSDESTETAWCNEMSSQRSSSGLFRYDEANAAWAQADFGLPRRVDCDDVDGVHDVSALFEMDGVLFASVEGATYRSTDRGEHWTLIANLADLRGVASCGGDLIALKSDGTFAESRDHGISFSPASFGAEVAMASSLVTFGGRCIVGLLRNDGEPTLLVSEDGDTFSILDPAFHAPTRLLAASDQVLAIGTVGQGVHRLSLARTASP
jgi:hypothetical protein